MENDIVIRATGSCDSDADNLAIKQIETIGKAYKSADHNGERLRIHVVLHNQSVVDTLRRTPLEGWMKDNIELYAYSFSDLSAISLLGILPNSRYRLDFEPINVNDDKTIHLVLVGHNAYSESIAIHAALIAHYPNYSRDNALCTRITMVSDSMSDFDDFRRRNKNLLSHSYCREVKMEDKDIDVKTFAPKYAGSRRDFVDVDWEFVACAKSSDALNYKFEKWAKDESQLTTFVFCDVDESANLTNAINLSNSAVGKYFQIFIKSENSDALCLLHQLGRFENINAFGCDGENFDDFQSLIRMAQLVNFAYNNMRESTADEMNNGQTPMVVATDMPDEKELLRLWNRNDGAGDPELNTQKRWSNIYMAFSIPTKLRSIGIEPDKCNNLYAISDKDVEILAEAEHNRWSVEELILGFEPTTDRDNNEILEDINKRAYFKRLGRHDNLRNFKDLGVDQSGKSVVRYDIAIVRSMPLIVYSYNHKIRE